MSDTELSTTARWLFDYLGAPRTDAAQFVALAKDTLLTARASRSYARFILSALRQGRWNDDAKVMEVDNDPGPYMKAATNGICARSGKPIYKGDDVIYIRGEGCIIPDAQKPPETRPEIQKAIGNSVCSISGQKIQPGDEYVYIDGFGTVLPRHAAKASERMAKLVPGAPKPDPTAAAVRPRPID